MNSYIFYVDILRWGKYNEGKYCAEYGNSGGRCGISPTRSRRFRELRTQRYPPPEAGGLTHLKDGVVSTGGSTVSVAEPFCPTTSRNWEEATSLIGVKQHQKVVFVILSSRISRFITLTVPP
mgnify:CR=1 FL=1